MATCEEIVARIQEGEKQLIPVLWDQTRDFVAFLANSWALAWRKPGIEADDLIQSGFFAMLKAIEKFDSSRGGFIHFFKFYLMKCFSRELTDWEQLVSLDEETGEDLRLIDSIEDPGAAAELEDAEERIYQDQLRQIVRDALKELPENQSEAVRLRYLEGLTLKEAGKLQGVSKETMRQREGDALRNLKKNKDIRELWNGDRNYFKGTSLGSWKRLGMSSEELELFRKYWR